MGGVKLAIMPEPFPVPIGLRLNQAARIVERAFDDALAEAVGIREATLTHHLNAMDASGLVVRTRDDANRRVQVVTLTEAGEAAFLRLRTAAIAFDAELTAGIAAADLATIATLLARLAANVGGPEPAVPWSGLADGGITGPARRFSAHDDGGKTPSTQIE